MGALAGGAATAIGRLLKWVLGKGWGNDCENREGGGELFCQLGEGILHLPS